MQLVGRKEETEIMRDLLTESDSQFLAMFGRRRVGKTFLITKVYQKEIVFSCSGLQYSEASQQLENFWIEIQKQCKIVALPPKTWIEAFSQLENYINNLPKKTTKKVLFFDEISWFDTPKSGFLPAFTNFWNSFCSKRNDILLVICGSSASWIFDKIIKDKGGLHNRLTRTIRLDPFTVAETKIYLEQIQKVKLSLKDYIQIYSMIGGIPYYLNGVKKGKGITQIMNDLFLKKNAHLKFEYDNLFSALFKNHEKHEEVIRVLTHKNKGFTRKEIIQKSSFNSGGWLSKVLDELEQCGFLQVTRDYEKKKADNIFRLVDEYSIFYHKFLKDDQYKLGSTLAGSQSFRIWSGFAFENLCMKHVHQIAKALEIAGIEYRFYSFIDKGAKLSDGTQIDMIIDRADNCINIIEMKFRKGQYKMTKAEAKNINNKLESFIRKTKTKKNIFTTLITVEEAIKNEHYLETITNEIDARVFFA